MKDLENLNLVETLPEAISQDLSMKGMAFAFQRQFKKLVDHVDTGALFSNIDSLTSLQLDHLAAMFDLQTWRDYWPVSLKRSVMKSAYVNKSKVGTLSAVREALESIGSASRVTEWWEMTPKGTPHTFQITATLKDIEGTLTEQMQEDLHFMIKNSKPARSHYEFFLETTQMGGIGLCGYARSLVETRISNF